MRQKMSERRAACCNQAHSQSPHAQSSHSLIIARAALLCCFVFCWYQCSTSSHQSEGSRLEVASGGVPCAQEGGGAWPPRLHLVWHVEGQHRVHVHAGHHLLDGGQHKVELRVHQTWVRIQQGGEAAHHAGRARRGVAVAARHERVAWRAALLLLLLGRGRRRGALLLLLLPATVTPRSSTVHLLSRPQGTAQELPAQALPRPLPLPPLQLW
mmetsp:Transcript_19258/g.49022  ORF Transcript_19258/g.49022 Transcript_19258/m.49022 type:complete len:212 (-) Transcript_19258:2098-2733(-)